MNYNPLKSAIHKYMADLLKDKYPYHYQILERISHNLITEQDVREFGKLISELYQLGYMKATKDYTEKLAEQGINLEVYATRLEQ